MNRTRSSRLACFSWLSWLPLLLVIGLVFGCSPSDPENLTASFASATATMDEDAGPGMPMTVEITLNISGLTLGNTASVSYETSNVTATANDDYEPLIGGSTFVNTAPTMITLSSIPDALFEGDEEFLLKITSVTTTDSSLNVATGTSEVVVRIVDNDPDNVPPVVSSTFPAAGAMGVSTGAILTATFDEDLDPATIDDTTFSVDGGVTGMVAYDAGTRTASLTPSTPLASSTAYTATLTTGITDDDGNALAADFVWSFNTGNVNDSTPPTTTATPPGGSYATPQMVALDCTDDPGGSGCNMTLYCFGAGCTPSMVYMAPLAVTTSTDLRYRSVDAAGNMEAIRTETYDIGTPTAAQLTGQGSARAVDLVTADGGYVVACDTNNAGALFAELWVMRLAPDNSVQWAFGYDTPAPMELAADIRQTSDGGFIVLASTLDLVNPAGDVWILKLDPDGSIAWQNTYGGTDVTQAQSLRETSDGGFVFCGIATGLGIEAFVVKLMADGTIDWQQRFPALEDAQAVRQTSDGGYVVTGHSSSVGAGNLDLWVMKLMADGSVDWQATYGTLSTERAHDIEETSDLGFVVLGERVVTSTNLWALKLASDGVVEWQTEFGGSMTDLAGRVRPTAAGGFAIAGSTGSFGTNGSLDSWFLELDADGNLVRERVFGSEFLDFGEALEQTGDGGYVLVGGTQGFGAGFPTGAPWILKLDANGSIGSPCAVETTSMVAPVDTSISAASVSSAGSADSLTRQATTASPTPRAATPQSQCP